MTPWLTLLVATYFIARLIGEAYRLRNSVLASAAQVVGILAIIIFTTLIVNGGYSLRGLIGVGA